MASGVDHIEALNVCLDIYRNDALPAAYRASVIQRCVCTILKCVSVENIRNFFALHIKFFASVISEKVRSDSSPELPVQLQIKLACFLLIESLFFMLQRDDFYGPSGIIHLAYSEGLPSPVAPNELIKFFSSSSGIFGCVNETHLTSVSVQVAELRRVYHCSAYNAMASIILCTQKEEKFHGTFLFKENPAKAERMFDNLVDLTRFV